MFDLKRLFSFGSDNKDPEEAPKGYSLHVGLNSVDPEHYDGWDGKLNACENDALHLAYAMKSRGFATQVLRTATATSSNFFNALDVLAITAVPGDLVVVSNSSHGGQVPDYDGDESDKMDETICLFDRQVTDDELALMWSLFRPGVRLFFISDSCHSGTVVRAMGETSVLLQKGSKAMPPDVQIRTARRNERQYLQASRDAQHRGQIRAHVLSFGACQDNQTAMDGPVNGAFTGALLQALRDHPHDCYGRIATRVRRSLPPSQTPSYTFVGPRLDSFEKAVAFSI